MLINLNRNWVPGEVGIHYRSLLQDQYNASNSIYNWITNPINEYNNVTHNDILGFVYHKTTFGINFPTTDEIYPWTSREGVIKTNYGYHNAINGIVNFVVENPVVYNYSPIFENKEHEQSFKIYNSSTREFIRLQYQLRDLIRAYKRFRDKNVLLLIERILGSCRKILSKAILKLDNIIRIVRLKVLKVICNNYRLHTQKGIGLYKKVISARSIDEYDNVKIFQAFESLRNNNHFKIKIQWISQKKSFA